MTDQAQKLRISVGTGAMRLQDAIDQDVINGMNDIAYSAAHLRNILQDRGVEHEMIVSFLVGAILKGTE